MSSSRASRRMLGAREGRGYHPQPGSGGGVAASMRALALVVPLLALAACGTDAPTPDENGARGRHERVEVEAGDAERFRADLRLALGDVHTARAARGLLFSADADLPAGGLKLDAETEQAGDEVQLDLRLQGEATRLRDLGRGVDWVLAFSDETPLDLRLDLGAARADLDLGGLPFSALTLRSGAAQAEIEFSEPAPTPLPVLDVEAGASTLRLSRLGNARAERLRFRGGVGTFSLDLSGAPPEPGAEVDVKVGVARLDLALPRGVPLVLDVPRSFAAAVSLPEGLTTLGGGRYASPEADGEAAPYAVRLRSGPGRVRVRWAE